MAGMPIRKARKVAELEDQAISLSIGVFLEFPRNYREHPDPDDPLSNAWNNAVDLTMNAMHQLEHLGNLLRVKAGIKGPSPREQIVSSLDAEDADQPKGESGNLSRNAEEQDALDSQEGAETGSEVGVDTSHN